MANYIGDIIFQCRKALDETQDEFGRRFEVSGPAIFKFEKGYVLPSLELWLRICDVAKIDERRAVLLWTKSRLPDQYQQYVELQGVASDAASSGTKAKGRQGMRSRDYSKMRDRDTLLNAINEDDSFPATLQAMIADPEMWSLYKPTGKEINQLCDIFAPMGRGTTYQFREALILLREFNGVEGA